MPTTTDPMRAHVLELLRGGHAHTTFEDAVKDIPRALRGTAPAGSPHTAWQLVEHIRLAQEDILRFSRNTDGSYRELDWPADYWPPTAAPPSDEAWERSVRAVTDGRQQMEALIADERNDLFAPFPWGDGQTLLREALLVADHGSYHVGQLVLVRRELGSWKG
jgi:uncharacterized damage-inducible protein DinB